MQWPSMALQAQPTTFNMKALTRNTLNGMPGNCPPSHLMEKFYLFWRTEFIQSCCHSWEWSKFSSIEHMSTAHTPSQKLNKITKKKILFSLHWILGNSQPYDRSAGRQRGQGIVEKSVANQFSSFRLPGGDELPKPPQDNHFSVLSFCQFCHSALV